MSAAAVRQHARRFAVDIGEIVAGLAARADALVAELLPRGVREGHEWRVGSLAGEPGRSMAVHLGGAKAGVWSDFSSGEGGDALDLVAGVLFRGDKKKAVQWALAWLGFDQAGRAPAATPTLPRARKEDDVAAEMRSAAFRIWIGARPGLRGTLAEVYLAGRGIRLDRLGRQPRALRFCPRLKHPSGTIWPALVAAITRGDRHVAIHRTWLAEDGNGKARPPAGYDGPFDAKMTLGSYRGGLIPLWRGASGKKLKDAPAGETIVLSEGIEDGLSCALAMPEYRVAAAVSLANMGALELPPQIARVIIAAQNDPWFDDRQGREHGARRGLDRAIRHFQRQGRTVLIARPPNGAKDMNDLLRGVA